MLFKKKILYKDWLWYWMQKKKDYIKESTYSNYSNIISNHIIPELGNIKLANLNNKLLQEYLINKYKTGRLDGNGGLSNKTIRDIIAVVKSSLKYAIKEEMINNINLDFTYPKNGSKDKIYIMSKKDQEKKNIGKTYYVNKLISNSKILNNDKKKTRNEERNLLKNFSMKFLKPMRDSLINIPQINLKKTNS